MVGNWNNGWLEGQAQLTSGEFTYKGEFKHNRKHGWGVMSNGKEIYEGSWVSDQKEGMATLKYENNATYNGEFKQNKRA